MIAGSDEAGKGDYFGYIAVACVACDEKTLKEMGVRDSKSLSSTQISRLEEEIKKRCIYSIVSVSPKRYNQLHKDSGGVYNLNQILGWMHAKAIKEILGQCTPKRIIVDKFGDEANVLKNIEGVDISFLTSGESDRAVAAASILARAEFLRKHEALSRRLEMPLPRGSAHVKEAARKLIEKHGREILTEVAKVHFRITEEL
ncbi:MAG: ribonuclease HIII [Candidatus Hydrothermarchaeales archaeon]